MDMPLVFYVLEYSLIYYSRATSCDHILGISSRFLKLENLVECVPQNIGFSLIQNLDSSPLHLTS